MKAVVSKYAPKSAIRNLTVVLLVLFAASELLNQLPALTGFDQTWIDAHTRNNGVTGTVLFLAIATGLLSVGMPRQVVAFLAGYAFGFTEGFIYATLAATISCACCFTVSRLWARRWVNNRYPAKIAKINGFLQKHCFLKTIVIRLLPIGNNLLTNLAAGVTTVKPAPFIFGSAIGYIPQMMIFSLMGKGVVVQSSWKMALSVGLLGLSALLGVYLYRQFKAGTNLDDSDKTVTTTLPSGFEKQ